MNKTVEKSNVATAKNALVKGYERQEKFLLSSIELAKKQLERLQKNKKKAITLSIVHPVKEMTKEKLVAKANKIKGNDFMIEGLKIIGRPARVREIADRLMTAKVAKFKGAIPSKKKLTQILYNAASMLSNAGEIKRKPFDEKTFEYSLKSYKVA